MDTIFIRGLSVQTLIGIYSWEQGRKQEVLLDIEMANDARVAAGSDKIADALDYKKVVDRVTEIAESGKFSLVETLAENLAQCILREFSVPGVRVGVTKTQAIANSHGVGVRIARGLNF